MKTRVLEPLPRGFHGDRHLLCLIDELVQRAEVFIETGSNVGSTLGHVARAYPDLTCLSCEPNLEAFEVARVHACVRGAVSIFPEMSQDFLQRLERDHADLFDRSLLAWLDAHDYGYDWPLRDEISFMTRKFQRGFLLIDDFQVPHDERFGWDSYDGQECSFEYVRSAIDPRVTWRLYYPAYEEHTSPWHPLRGWGLLQFTSSSEELESLDQVLPKVCVPAETSTVCAASGIPDIAGDPTDPMRPAALAFARGDLKRAEALLRAEVLEDPESSLAWNDLGACLAHLGMAEDALTALREALRFDSDNADARANYTSVARALQPAGEHPLAVAPGAWGRMVHRDPFDDLHALIDFDEPTIVDGGANSGHTVAKLRTRFPAATIHAFEPIPELAERVRARFVSDPKLIVHRAALAAEEGTLRFGVRANDVMSSVLKPSALKVRYHGAAVALEEELEVLALRLSSAVPEPIDILKLDLQGYELEALLGLGERLAEVRVLLTEVEFVPLYDDQPLFGDLDGFLRQAGFRLFHLYDIWSHPDGQITSGDALYVNERYFS